MLDRWTSDDPYPACREDGWVMGCSVRCFSDVRMQRDGEDLFGLSVEDVRPSWYVDFRVGNSSHLGQVLHKVNNMANS